MSAVAFADGPVGAATEGSLRARAAVVESHLAAESAALQSNAVTYLAEHSAYLSSTAAVSHTRAKVRVIELTVATDQATVRRAAVAAYVSAGSESEIGLYLVGRPDELATSATYERVATDRITSTIAALRGDEVTLTSNLTTEQAEANAAAQALAETNASRHAVVQEVNSERSALSSVNGQLAALVQREEIAREQAAAAAAAQAAAQAAATAAAAAQAAAGPPVVVGAAPVVLTSVVPSSLADAFAAIRRCESSDDYSLNTGNGYYGAYQFSAATWERLGGAGVASAASPADQDAAAYRLYESSGWGSWAECAAVAGL